MGFKSFQAASRKRNMIPFALFPANSDLSWIEDNTPSQYVNTVVFSVNPVFDAFISQYQEITVTGDCSPTFVYNTSATNIPEGTPLVIRWVMSGGPWNITLPSNLSVNPEYSIGEGVTVTSLWWFTPSWEFQTPPVINPS